MIILILIQRSPIYYFITRIIVRIVATNYRIQLIAVTKNRMIAETNLVLGVLALVVVVVIIVP